VKVEKITDTYVKSVDTDKQEVRLDRVKGVFGYLDDSMILLLQKAMTVKATFIIKDRVISWIVLTEEVRAR
jgi:hypothetical protein